MIRKNLIRAIFGLAMAGMTLSYAEAQSARIKPDAEKPPTAEQEEDYQNLVRGLSTVLQPYGDMANPDSQVPPDTAKTYIEFLDKKNGLTGGPITLPSSLDKHVLICNAQGHVIDVPVGISFDPSTIQIDDKAAAAAIISGYTALIASLEKGLDQIGTDLRHPEIDENSAATVVNPAVAAFNRTINKPNGIVHLTLNVGEAFRERDAAWCQVAAPALP